MTPADHPDSPVFEPGTRRLTPIVVLVTDETLRALNDYVVVTESFVRNDAPDVEHALGRIQRNGWTSTMLIAGQLLAEALGQ